MQQSQLTATLWHLEEERQNIAKWITWNWQNNTNNDRWVAGWSFAGVPVVSFSTGITALCPWVRHINPCLLLVQPRKIRPGIAEKLLTQGHKEKNQTNNDHKILAQNFFLYYSMEEVWCQIFPPQKSIMNVANFWINAVHTLIQLFSISV